MVAVLVLFFMVAYPFPSAPTEVWLVHVQPKGYAAFILFPHLKMIPPRWAQVTYQISERRVSRLLPMARASFQYQSRREPQEALRIRLRELAASRVRFGYRRLTVLLRRDGWPVNAKRIY